jgi:hypothetical protein
MEVSVDPRRTRSACHCGAVRIILEPAPTRVRDCNCSICRRYGALWAYTRDRTGTEICQATVMQGVEALEAYIWGNRWSGAAKCVAA